jgi:heme/copper-type cytochrome/quinol oxidase subunit 2
VSVVVLGSIAAAVGYIVYRAFAVNPERRPGDVWSTWFTGFVVLVVSSWFVPFLVLFVFIDSDHSLADRIGLVYLVWTVAHLAVAGLAFRVMRSLWRAPETTESVDAADSEPAPTN